MPQYHRYARFVAGLALLSAPAMAQQVPAPTMTPVINEPTNPALRGFRWRSIGPIGQGVRVDDFAVDEKHPTTFYHGFGVRGVPKTEKKGTTLDPIFDTYGASSIAD